VKLTIPVGVFDGVVVSATVAVQVEVPVGTIVAGLQATVVVVASFAVTVMVLDAVGVPGLWAVSPPYVPVTVAVPAVVPAMKVTEQLPADKVQLVPTVLPVAVPETVKLTVPVGVMAVPVEVSVTVARQLEVWPTNIELGLQATVVEVERKFTVILLEVPVLVLCVVSPP
jgi:hypothetical protein